MITIHELTEILVRADRLGLTTYKDAQAAAWKEVLDMEMPTLDKRLATEAVTALASRAESVPARGIRPYDLMTRARQISSERQSFVPVELPAGLSPSQEVKWKQAWAFAVGRGADRDRARAYCEQETGLRFPVGIESSDRADVRERINELKHKFGKRNI